MNESEFRVAVLEVLAEMRVAMVRLADAVEQSQQARERFVTAAAVPTRASTTGGKR